VRAGLRRLMVWVLVAIIAVVGLAVFAVIVGLFLPPEHVASRTLRVERPPEVIWQVITDYADQPIWRSELSAIERLPDRQGHQVWRERHQQGRPITLEIAETIRPRRLVTRIADEGGPFSGRWEFDITPAGSGSQVTITEFGRLPNPFFRFVSRFIIGQTAFIEQYLSGLASKFGEPATIN